MHFRKGRTEIHQTIEKEFRALKKHRHSQKPEEDRRLVYENIKETEKKWKTDTAAYAERLAEQLRLPPDIIRENPMVHMLGTRRVVIENYKKLVDYQEECIKILSKAGTIQIAGCHLRIAYYTRDEIKIEGFIKGIEVIP